MIILNTIDFKIKKGQEARMIIFQHSKDYRHEYLTLVNKYAPEWSTKIYKEHTKNKKRGTYNNTIVVEGFNTHKIQ